MVMLLFFVHFWHWTELIENKFSFRRSMAVLLEKGAEPWNLTIYFELSKAWRRVALV